MTKSAISFTVVRDELSNRPSLSLEVKGDIFLTPLNGDRNLLSELHPVEHMPEPSVTVIGTSTPGASNYPTAFVKAALSWKLTAELSQSTVQIVTANSTTESIIGF